MIAETELILNPDGSIYHLALHPEDIADDVIVVGDPARVKAVSRYLEHPEEKASNREFITHTGMYNKKRVTVISTGIGTDNIDIVLNELDALVNVDLHTRMPKKEKRSLNIVRIGTSGSLQADVPADSFVLSSHGIGFDGLLNFYSGLERINEEELASAFISQTGWNEKLPYPYVVSASSLLVKKLGAGMITGMTATAPGFYGPQGREIRLRPAIQGLNEKLTAFSYKGLRITNFEMETSALYGLAAHLGHRACTVCTIIANRITRHYSTDHHLKVDELIRLILSRLTD